MINSDIPIINVKDDLLDRSVFVENLTDSLLVHNEQPLCLGLYGPWGSGKTSLLNLIEENIKGKDPDIIQFRFNPWLCSNTEQLITQFFHQLIGILNLKGDKVKQVCSTIEQYSESLAILKYIPQVGQLIDTGRIIVNETAKALSKDDYDLQKQKNKITKALKEGNVKIIVFIDDIDRLTDDEIRLIFQLVKSLADFPNMIYILAFDYKVVTTALASLQRGSGEEYLAKIVQIPFEIPLPKDEKVHEIFKIRLSEILGDIPENRWDGLYWTELFEYGIRKYIETLRNVNRFINLFSLKYEMVKKETDPADLIGITCLQVFEPQLYSYLPSFKNELLGTRSSIIDIRRDDELKKAALNRLNPILNDDTIVNNRDAAMNILALLFPNVKSLYKDVHVGGVVSSESYFVRQKIADPDHFDRYFTLSLGENAIPANIIHDCIYTMDESGIESILYDYYDNGKIKTLIDYIYRYTSVSDSDIEDISQDRIKFLIQTICINWHRFEVEDSGGFLSEPFQYKLRKVFDTLICKMEKASRYDFIRRLFSDPKVNQYTLTILLWTLELPFGRFSDRSERVEKQLIDLEELIEIEDVFKMRSIDLLNTGDWIGRYKGFYFWSLYHRMDEKTAEDKVGLFINNDIALAQVISYHMGYSYSSTKGWKVHREALEKIIDPHVAYDRMIQFVTSDGFKALRNEEKEDVLGFLLDIETYPNGPDEFESISADMIKDRMAQLDSVN